MDRMEKNGRTEKATVTAEARPASKFEIMLDSVRRLLRRGAIGNLDRMVNKMHPADIAKVLHQAHRL